MLSKALEIQQEKEEDEHEAILSKLQDEVTRLQNALEEKDKEITSLMGSLAEAKEGKEEAERTFNDNMTKMKEQGDTINELRTNLKKEKEKSQKLLETQGQLQDQCFDIASQC